VFTGFYPSSDDVKGDGLNCLPPLVRVFVDKLIRPPLKQTALGQNLVQAAKPRGCLMSLLVATAADVDKSRNRHNARQTGTDGIQSKCVGLNTLLYMCYQL